MPFGKRKFASAKGWIEKSKAIEFFRSADIGDCALISRPGTSQTEDLMVFGFLVFFTRSPRPSALSEM